MIILGVDPGSRATGYGVVELQDGQPKAIKILETGTICPKSGDPLQDRIAAVYKNLGEVISEHNPKVMVLEKLYAHYKHPATAAVLGHARGVICLLAAQHQLDLQEHSVKRIRKALLGNGNATKEQTRDAVAHAFKIKTENLTLDASDALALALGYAQMQRF